jgi:predicted SAM-dependent methyltransferase
MRNWSAQRVRRKRLAELAHLQDLRLNIGSGELHLVDWINCDIRTDDQGQTLWMDATQTWPFPSQSAVAVNSEHMIEHLERDGTRVYLREAFRTLRPGGVIRTSTPDLAGICRAYFSDGPELEQHRVHGYEAASRAEMVNNYFYMWDHRQLYDFETLALLLREAGFEQIERAEYGQSRHAVLRGIDRHDPDPLFTFTLAIDAVKPAAASPSREPR